MFSNSLAEQPAWDTGHMDTSSWPAPYPLQEEQPPCEAMIATCTEPSILGSGHRDSGDPSSGAKAHMTRIGIEQQFGSRVCQSEAAVNNAGLPGYRKSKPGPWSSGHSTWQWTYRIRWTHRLSHIPSIPGCMRCHHFLFQLRNRGQAQRMASQDLRLLSAELRVQDFLHSGS